MAIREFLQITKESSYLTPMTSPVRGTDQIVIRLDGGNAFTMRPDPQAVDIVYGGGFATRRFSVTDTMELTGALTCKLCYSQMPILMGMGLVRNTGSSPWATTEPVGDLASVTIDHAIFQDDTSTYKRRRYLGVKVPSGRFEISRESKVGTLTLQLRGSTPQGNAYDSSADPNSTIFPTPSDADYPTDVVLFSNSGGNTSLYNTGGSPFTFTKYDSLMIDWENNIDFRFFASRFVQIMRSYGRTMHLEADVVLDASPYLRGLYEGLTPLTMSTAFGNGTHTGTFNFEGNIRLSRLDDNLETDKIYYQKLTGVNGWDPASGTDFSFTYS